MLMKNLLGKCPNENYVAVRQFGFVRAMIGGNSATVTEQRD